MALSDFGIVTKSLTTRLFSTVTTALMVAVAVSMLLVILSMRDAGESAFDRGTGNVDILITRDNSPLTSVLNSMFYANVPPRPIEWSKYLELARSQPFEFAIPVATGDTYRGAVPVVATTREFFELFEPAPGVGWTVAEGELFDANFEVVVGARAARETGLRVGDDIVLTHGSGEGAHVHTEFVYEVVGILGPTGGPHDRALYTDLDSTWILHAHDRRLIEHEAGPRNEPMSITTKEDLVEADRLITGIYTKVITRPGRSVSASLAPVFVALRSDPSIIVAQPADEVRKLFAIVSNVDQILIGMAAVVMVSSAIGILLAMYNSMAARRRQIAVLRVLGCSRGRMFGLVLTESTMLGLLGAAAGVVLSVIGAAVVAGVLKARLGLVIDPTIGLRPAIIVAGSAVVLAALAGAVPAAMAYRTSVARSLRPMG
jgi:putative ABC transport system permease protein